MVYRPLDALCQTVSSYRPISGAWHCLATPGAGLPIIDIKRFTWKAQGDCRESLELDRTPSPTIGSRSMYIVDLMEAASTPRKGPR